MDEDPRAYTLRLAEVKAQAARQFARTGAVILAADTTVADGADLLGKPASPAMAKQMLQRLRGRTHQVYTAIALLDASRDQLLTDLCISQVPMRDYTDEEIDAYVASGDPLDKAGAYAIQNGAFRPVIQFGGCYASVMGLPLCHLTRSLQKMNVTPRVNISRACQNELRYACPIFEAVLRNEDAG